LLSIGWILQFAAWAFLVLIGNKWAHRMNVTSPWSKVVATLFGTVAWLGVMGV